MLKKQEATVLDNITHLSGKSLAKGIADDLMSLVKENSAIRNAVNPILQSLAIEQGSLAMDFSGSDQEYSQSTAVINAIEASTSRMSGNFNDETISQLSDSLGQGIQNSESISQLSDRVASVYGDATSYRSDRVARTEAQYAANAATLDAYQQNPVVVSMTWYANPDACEYCAELDGTTVGTEEVFLSQGDSIDVGDDSFQADYGDVETPPLHPNCSCTIVPETDSSDVGIGDNSDGLDSIDSTDGETDPSIDDNAGTDDTTNTDQSSSDGTIDENGMPAIPDRATAEATSPPPDNEPTTIDAFRGEGSNVSNGNYALGYGYYVARTEDAAAPFGEVSAVTLKLKESDILKLPDQTSYQTLVNEAIRTYPDLPFNEALPKLVLSKGYKAAELDMGVDLLGGMAVYDEAAIPK